MPEMHMNGLVTGARYVDDPARSTVREITIDTDDHGPLTYLGVRPWAYGTAHGMRITLDAALTDQSRAPGRARRIVRPSNVVLHGLTDRPAVALEACAPLADLGANAAITATRTADRAGTTHTTVALITDHGVRLRAVLPSDEPALRADSRTLTFTGTVTAHLVSPGGAVTILGGAHIHTH